MFVVFVIYPCLNIHANPHVTLRKVKRAGEFLVNADRTKIECLWVRQWEFYPASKKMDTSQLKCWVTLETIEMICVHDVHGVVQLQPGLEWFANVGKVHDFSIYFKSERGERKLSVHLVTRKNSFMLLVQGWHLGFSTPGRSTRQASRIKTAYFEMQVSDGWIMLDGVLEVLWVWFGIIHYVSAKFWVLNVFAPYYVIPQPPCCSN